jgi:hypothetical protein
MIIQNISRLGWFNGHVREYPHNIWPYMVQYLRFRILKFPLITSNKKNMSTSCHPKKTIPPGTLEKKNLGPRKPKAFRSSRCTRRKLSSADPETLKLVMWGLAQVGYQKWPISVGFSMLLEFWLPDELLTTWSILKCRGCASHVR